MDKTKKKSSHKKIMYLVLYLVFTAITFVFGMATDTWDDDKFKNL